jgi:hypothetical protein
MTYSGGAIVTRRKKKGKTGDLCRKKGRLGEIEAIRQGNDPRDEREGNCPEKHQATKTYPGRTLPVRPGYRAGEGNRTLVTCLEGRSFTIKLLPQKTYLRISVGATRFELAT